MDGPIPLRSHGGVSVYPSLQPVTVPGVTKYEAEASGNYPEQPNAGSNHEMHFYRHRKS